ncbi:MAG: hypothetical protein ACRD3Q_19965, partial [Terriglobales bacterium]
MNAFPENPDPDEPSTKHGVDEPSGAASAARDGGDSSSPSEPAATAQPNIISTQDGMFFASIEPPRDPAWNGWDILRLAVLTVVALIAAVFIVAVLAHILIYPRFTLGYMARVPLVAVAGQGLAYLLVLAYMYVLVTRERHRPDFLNAIHWNWPSSPAVFVLAGIVLS